MNTTCPKSASAAKKTSGAELIYIAKRKHDDASGRTFREETKVWDGPLIEGFQCVRQLPAELPGRRGQSSPGPADAPLARTR